MAYEDRFVEFQKKYGEKGVKFVAINANKASEDLAVMKTRAEEKGFNFPYVFDASGKSATEYGAKVTPHIFVLDGERKVAYVGAFDDSQEKPTKNYVADAVDAILAGKKVEVTNTKAVGCGIATSKVRCEHPTQPPPRDVPAAAVFLLCGVKPLPGQSFGERPSGATRRVD